MRYDFRQWFIPSAENDYTPHMLQKTAMVMMLLLTVLTYSFSSVQTLLWTSSDWLVSTILPAVVVDLTNEARADGDLPGLQHNPTLDQAAQLKAKHMAENRYFAHHSPVGVTPWHWFNQVEYRYAHAGENLAVHFTDSGKVVEAWMESPTHRENIENADFTEIGVGTARGQFEGQKTIFVVQLFGTPAMTQSTVEAESTEAASATTEGDATDSLEAESEAANEASTTPATTVELARATTASAATPEGQNSVLAERSSEADSAPDRDEEAPAAPDENEGGGEDAPESVKNTEFAQPSAPATTTTPEVATSASPSTNSSTMVVQEDQTISLYSSMVATSSGLVPAPASLSPAGSDGSRWTQLLGVVTQPQFVLQLLYGILGTFVIVVLLLSVLIEIRQQRPVQIAYGIGLLVLMSGLYYAHTAITGSVLVA